MASPERKASTLLLSLIAAKAATPGSFSSDKSEVDDDEQRTQTMMYAARMTYLDDSDPIKPDSLFMTRKQAQKVAQRHDTAVTLKKLDGVAGSQTRKAHAANAASASPAVLAAWKRANNTTNRGPPVDECDQVWEAKFQAGCHFWQNVDTAECRVHPPLNAQLVRSHDFPLDVTDTTNGNAVDDNDGEANDEDPPFPDSFAFLNVASDSASNSISSSAEQQ